MLQPLLLLTGWYWEWQLTQTESARREPQPPWNRLPITAARRNCASSSSCSVPWTWCRIERELAPNSRFVSCQNNLYLQGWQTICSSHLSSLCSKATCDLTGWRGAQWLCCQGALMVTGILDHLPGDWKLKVHWRFPAMILDQCADANARYRQSPVCAPDVDSSSYVTNLKMHFLERWY